MGTGRTFGDGGLGDGGRGVGGLGDGGRGAGGLHVGDGGRGGPLWPHCLQLWSLNLLATPVNPFTAAVIQRCPDSILLPLIEKPQG